MNIKKFKFPESTFDTPTNAKLLAEADARGFLHGDTKYNRLFNELFFGGGTLKFKEGLEPLFQKNAVVYLKSLMASFSPKQEHKEAVSALLLSELVDI